MIDDDTLRLLLASLVLSSVLPDTCSSTHSSERSSGDSILVVELLLILVLVVALLVSPHAEVGLLGESAIHVTLHVQAVLCTVCVVLVIVQSRAASLGLHLRLGGFELGHVVDCGHFVERLIDEHRLLVLLHIQLLDGVQPVRVVHAVLALPDLHRPDAIFVVLHHHVESETRLLANGHVFVAEHFEEVRHQLRLGEDDLPRLLVEEQSVEGENDGQHDLVIVLLLRQHLEEARQQASGPGEQGNAPRVFCPRAH
mmetsp:Transcript_3957/g.11188  ORF Transcript_3957/g.11188 Transcript_3957/m.11188 type:complete len:255 (-) Transcript_3957:1355-2119(-)